MCVCPTECPGGFPFDALGCRNVLQSIVRHTGMNPGRHPKLEFTAGLRETSCGLGMVFGKLWPFMAASVGGYPLFGLKGNTNGPPLPIRNSSKNDEPCGSISPSPASGSRIWVPASSSQRTTHKAWRSIARSHCHAFRKTPSITGEGTKNAFKKSDFARNNVNSVLGRTVAPLATCLLACRSWWLHCWWPETRHSTRNRIEPPA